MEKCCPNCGTAAPEGARFCMSCGTAIPQENTCPNCGQVLPENAVFCFACGSPVGGGKKNPPEQAPAQKRTEAENRTLKDSGIPEGAHELPPDETFPYPTYMHNGVRMARADDFFEQAAREKVSGEKGGSPTERSQTWDVTKDADNMVRRRQEDERRRQSNEDEDPYVEIPKDADADVGSPTEYLRKTRSNSERPVSSDLSALADDEMERDDEAAEDEPVYRRRGRGRKTGKSNAEDTDLIAVEKKRFRRKVNQDGYYDSRLPNDYELTEDEVKGSSKFTLFLGIIGIIAFAVVVILVRNYI